MMKKIEHIFLDTPKKYKQYNIYHFDFEMRSGIKLHEDMQGSHLRELSKNPLKLSFYEIAVYERIILDNFFLVDRDSLILDLGCGDGRFTKTLLEAGFTNIVSLDSSLVNLISLHEFCQQNDYLGNVTLVRSDAGANIFCKSVFSCILAIGIFYYLHESYESCIEFASDWLVSGGLLIESEPDQKGQKIKTLLFDGIDNFLNQSNSNTFIESYGGIDYTLQFIDYDQCVSVYKKNNLIILKQIGLPILPLLMIVGLHRGLISSQDLVNNSNSLKKYFANPENWSPPYKHFVLVSQKN